MMYVYTVHTCTVYQAENRKKKDVVHTSIFRFSIRLDTCVRTVKVFLCKITLEIAEHGFGGGGLLQKNAEFLLPCNTNENTNAHMGFCVAEHIN